MGRGNKHKAQANNRAAFAYSLLFLWEPNKVTVQLYLLSKGQHWTSLHHQGQAEDLAHTFMSCL